MNLTFGSICSGIEAASVAWHPLGWRAAFVSEIEAFPCAVLKHHWPQVPNLGDMTKFAEWHLGADGTFYDPEIDVLVGGTPCQSFSIAGLRKGLDDPRGNFMLTFGAIAARYRPRWLVWENVPGVLSSKGGRDFASFLGLLTGQEIAPPAGGWENSGVLAGIDSAYGLCWRILDAQYFGVAQRRRRVFVVGHLGGFWQRAAAVLLERASLCGNPPPRRETGQGFTHGIAPSLGASGRGFERNGESRGQDPVIAEPISIQEIGKRESGPPMNGVGHGAPGDPMYTLQKSAVHGVAQPIGIDGSEVGFALRANASHSGDKGDGGVNTTMVAEVAPTLDQRSGRSGENSFATSGGLVAEQVAPAGHDAQRQVDGGGLDARAGRMRGREGCAGGGKGPLLSEDKSLTLAANANDQVLFQPEAFRTSGNCGAWSTGDKTDALTTGTDPNSHVVAHSLKAEGFDASEDGTGRGTPLVPEILAHGQGNAEHVKDGSPSLTCNHEAPIGFIPEISPTLRAGGNKTGGDRPMGMDVDTCDSLIAQRFAVRRLTPRECERLQGFPDDYTSIPTKSAKKLQQEEFRWLILHRPELTFEEACRLACDGPRYKALGNSMAVPVMHWLGQRIEWVETLCPLNN